VKEIVMGLPNPGLTLEPGRTALVLTDLQNDFLSPGGNGWALLAASYARNGTVENLGWPMDHERSGSEVC
jgi:nicotinamidase-related amidase